MSEKIRVTIPESAIRPNGSIKPPHDKLLRRGAKLIDTAFSPMGVLYLFEVTEENATKNKDMRKL